MMKYELAKLFCDVDDRFIEGAKPEAQKPVELTIRRRSPIKFLAAASCAAVVLVGGALMLNALHNRGMSALDNSNIASLLKEDPNSSDISDNSDVTDEKTGNWYNDEQIYYEGEYYKVPWDSRTEYKYDVEEKRVGVLTGIRRISPNRIEMVTVMVNHCTSPVKIRCYGADSVVEMDFAPKRSHIGEISIVDNMSHKPFGHILQPGEMCFQKAFYIAECGEYEVDVKYAFQEAVPETQHGFFGASHKTIHVVMTEDGFKDPYEMESDNSDVKEEKTGNWYNEEQIYYEGEYYKVPEDSRIAYKHYVEDEMVGVLTGIRRISPNRIEMVTVMINHCTRPAGIRCYGYDSVVEMEFGPCKGHVGEFSHSDQMPNKPIGAILQPGEVCYQKAVYDAGCGKYEAKIRFAFQNADTDTIYGFGGGGDNFIHVVMTEDGFKEPYEVESDDSFPSPSDSGELDLITDIDDDGIPDKLKELNPDVTDEEWEFFKDFFKHNPK